MKRKIGSTAFDTINTIIMFIIGLITIYPFIYILAISLNDATDAARGGIYFFPRVFTIDSYRAIFTDSNLLNAAWISVARTVIGTFLSLLFCSAAAYAFSKKRSFPGGQTMYIIIVITMFVNGGLIPIFMLYRWIKIYNTFWVYIFPYLINAFYIILMRTFFMQLPASLEESAYLDGANEFTILFKIIIPLSPPILATIGLFVAVNHWNQWRDTLFFTTGGEELKTLQYKMMEIIQRAEAKETMMGQLEKKMKRIGLRTVTPESIKMAITIVATIPIVCVYPFLQKYFVKGIMIGAIKG